MDLSDEHGRLTEAFGRLRLKLLDLSKKNRMLNYSLGSRSKRHLQIVDEVIDETYRKLVKEEVPLRIDPLEEPEDTPSEEKTEEFAAALDHAKVSNLEYLTKLEALESSGRDDESELVRLERELRDRVRETLGLPPRPKKAELNRAEHARSIGIEPNFALGPTKTKPSHGDAALQTLKFPDELDRIMGKLVADARLSEQEMGISTLFLSFGFLEWYESDVSDKKAFAPLLLLPVKVEVKKQYGKNVYSLVASEGAAETNLSLQKLLETNVAFHRKLPSFETGEDEGAASIENYFAGVNEAIQGLNRWQIHRWMVLGHFAFGRFAVYSDLNPENWAQDPVDHSLVGAILRGTDNTGGDGALMLGDPTDYQIDEAQFETIAPFLIQDADASQHSALIDAMKGQNLVIQGPPGTGKSQTISNIIANALALDKTVLFVAEKQAALEVVKRRLERADLGRFCLELHSEKASPKAVLESLTERLKMSPVTAPAEAGRSLHENRTEIGKYLQALHAVQPGGRTTFDLIWKSIRGLADSQDASEIFADTKLPDDLLRDSERLVEAEERLARFAEASDNFEKAFGHPTDSPWASEGLSDIGRGQAEDLLATLRELAAAADDLSRCLRDNGLGVRSLSSLNEALRVAGEMKSPPPDAVGAIAHLDQNQLCKDLENLRSLREAEQELSGYPDLGNQSGETLATAVALGKLPLLEIYRECTPTELVSVASETAQKDRRLKDDIDQFRPALEMFGLDGSCARDAFILTAKAIMAWGKIQPEYRPALLLNPGIDEAAFGQLFKRWNDLLAKEAEWRRSLSAYGGQAWPAASALRSASELLKKGKVGLAIEAMKGNTKPVNELLARLGMTGAQDPSSRLTALASHVDALEEFESDDEASHLLGASWLGLETKFRLIEYGIRARKYLTDHAGSDIVARLLRIPAKDAARLQSFEPAAASLVREVSSRSDGLAGRSVDLARTMLADSIASMERVAATDPRGLLKAFDIPVRELFAAAKAEIERSTVADELAKSPLSADLARFDRSQTGIDQMSAGVEWLRALRASAPAPALLRQLSSANAKDEFGRLAQLAQQASPQLRRYEENLKALPSGIGLVERFGKAEPGSVAEKLRSLLHRKQELPEFLGLRRERRELEELGLGDFLDRSDAARIAPSRLPHLLEGALARRGATLARRSAEPLQNNTGASLEARRRQFAEKDRSKILDDRVRIKARLMTKKPLPGSNVGRRRAWTEMALIANEIGKERGFVPVRTLLAQAGKSVQALKPCFMMSPLSLAKFMKAGSLSFDLLVIDEASQMRPEDALGAMLRSKQIVVVGDQKQLPPTDFFARSGDGGTDDEDLDDYDDESILESCQKTFGLRRPLRWHYRSRCESLIRFSNERFYKRELITFPASKPSSFSIDLVRVAGSFQARCNPVEACRVAEEAITFMRHHAALNESDVPSLGIVALNIQQRDLIQEELNRLVVDDVLVEQYREKVVNKGEEFFIKNLENVQGDERDFVFISMTYGPEPGSAVLKQRFGPINRKQGHRRLNVLFSRARTRIGLFASFSSSDVKPTSESAEGVHVLQKYLEYAETRGRMATNPGGDGEPDSDFEVEVADRLRARGFTVDYQVGASGYKIDLGVRHPDFAERYLAGIECDGAAYHSSKSARDRDRLREEVLKDKGWQIARVWSTDWFDDPALQTDRLVAKLEALRARPAVVEDDYVIVGGREPEARAEEPTAPARDPSVEPQASHTDIVSLIDPDPLPTTDDPLSEAECCECLRRFRDGVIAAEIADWEAHRSLLRDAMIETFVRQKITDPDQWFDKIPGYLRQGTNPIEKGRYLERVCDIVARLGDEPASATRSATSRLARAVRN